MSLILEALRKSEAERQLGRVPGLLTPMPIATRARRRWSPLAAAVPALLAVAAAGWWFGGASVPWRQPSPATADVAMAPATSTNAIPVLRPMPAADPVEPLVRSAPPPVASPPPTVAAVDQARPGPAANPPAAVDVARETAAARAARPPTPADPAAVAAPATATASQSPLAPPPQTATAPLPATAAPARPVAETSTATVSTTAPAEPPLPTLASLDTARRNQLPPLRMSLHVFAESPAQRFALIDGRRYSEGQSIDALLQVHEIRREGVVLSLDGSRFLLPRP